MSSALDTSRPRHFPLAAAVAAAVAVIIGGGLWLGLGNDDETSGVGTDPFQNAVSDERVPGMTVTVRDDDGEPVADIAYDASEGRIPMRGTYAFLQTLDERTWSTAYTLHGDEIIEGVPEAFDDPAFSGPGPDTYRLPDLDADATYRICVEFIVGHPATDATGCSAPFHSS